jgi:hypothetical protein
MHPMVLLGDEAQVEARFSPLVLILMQNRCTACAKCTIGSEIIWMHSMELLDDVDHVESHFGLFGDNVSFGAK